MKLAILATLASLAILTLAIPPTAACPIPAPPCSHGCYIYDPCGITPVVPEAGCTVDLAIGVAGGLGGAAGTWAGAAANAGVRTVSNVVFGTPC